MQHKLCMTNGATVIVQQNGATKINGYAALYLINIFALILSLIRLIISYIYMNSVILFLAKNISVLFCFEIKNQEKYFLKLCENHGGGIMSIDRVISSFTSKFFFIQTLDSKVPQYLKIL